MEVEDYLYQIQNKLKKWTQKNTLSFYNYRKIGKLGTNNSNLGGKMTSSKNDITGDKQQTKVPSKEYKDNYDLIFGKGIKKDEEITEMELTDFARPFRENKNQHVDVVVKDWPPIK